MPLSYLCVRKEAANCCLPFQGFKRRNNLIYSNVSLTSLETKEQKGRNNCFFLTVASKLPATCSEVGMHQVR